MPASAPQGTRRAIAVVALIVLASVAYASCRSAFSRKYEYDEDVHLNLDGSATVYVNASVPALVALRGADLDPDPRARLDLNKVRALFESPVTSVENATGSRRDNRRYVHIRIDVPDIRRLSEAPPFAWSRYALEREDQVLAFRQVVGPSAGRVVENAGWSGNELVAFRLHLPSRVLFPNSPPREVQRGNIIVWEQPLVERIKGQPLTIEAHMETESILVRTLILFGITVALAAATFALAIWFVVTRKGSAEVRE